MSEAILGISAYYHDSAAALLVNGKILAAAQEERFTRKKYDASFPIHAIRFVLEEGTINNKDLNAIAFYEKSFIKFERLLETYHTFAPKGLRSFMAAMPVWMNEKLFIKRQLRNELDKMGINDLPLIFPDHHLSHAASAFYPSPFEEAAILTLDGVGEWTTTMIAYGKEKKIKVYRELHFPHSIGLLYSAFTYYTGFRVNGGEYKLMGLAAYGDSDSDQFKKYKSKILDTLLDIREDGSILLNMSYFDFATGLKMTMNKRWEKLFGIRRRKPDGPIDSRHFNLALAVQKVTEEIILKLAFTAKKLTGSSRLALAGGVALNSVANSRLLESGMFEDIWIPPAAGDAGGALGAAFAAWHIWNGKERKNVPKLDSMKSGYLGPGFLDKQISLVARNYETRAKHFEKFDRLIEVVARKIAKGEIVGWFQGKMEFGPRALGNRSILADARIFGMQKKINSDVKFRETFRPFAPSVLEEDVEKYFDFSGFSPYMLFVVPVKKERRKPVTTAEFKEMSLQDQLNHPRSDIPAVTHVDYTARPQTVRREVNPRFWKLISEFKKQTGYGLLLNTSFNIRGEPIVCTPDDAFQCFMKTQMDCLVMGNFLFQEKAGLS